MSSPNTIYAEHVIRRAVDILQDPTSVRWPLNELVRYLKDGQREIVTYRPDAMVQQTTDVFPVFGQTRQSLPAGALKLIEITRNVSGASSRPIRLINREILDAQSPGWHAASGAKAEILHYMYDPRDPTTYYIYPAAGVGAQIEIIYAAMPSETTITVANNTLAVDAGVSATAPGTSVTGLLGIPDIYVNPLTDYICYRAFSKDSEYAGNSARAQNHYAAFANALGIEIKATLSVAPTSPSNPNVASNRPAA